MKPLQKLYNSSGNEVILFPLEFLYLSPARDPDEHDKLALDFLGWNDLGRVYNCPCYAPFSGKVVYTGNDHNMIYQSLGPVEFADGTIDYATVLVAHSNTAPASVGSTFSQGELWYHTGNFGLSSGDHLHIEIAKGLQMWNSDGIGLNNAVHFYDSVYVNDTVLVRPENYNWKIFEGGIVPSLEKKRKKFPFYFYKKKYLDIRVR